MKVTIVVNDDDAGYLAKLLRSRYKKSRKIALSTLIRLAADEAAEAEAQKQKNEVGGWH